MVKIVSLLMMFIFSCSKDRIQKIYYNGIVWTGDDIIPMVSAIAVTDEFIIAVGDDEEILSMADKETDKINLLGKFVTPGFIDNHVHFISGGLQLTRVNLSDATTKEIFQELKGLVKKITEKTTISKNPSMDHMIIGTFWFKKAKDFLIEANKLLLWEQILRDKGPTILIMKPFFLPY